MKVGCLPDRNAGVEIYVIEYFTVRKNSHIYSHLKELHYCLKMPHFILLKHIRPIRYLRIQAETLHLQTSVIQILVSVILRYGEEIAVVYLSRGKTTVVNTVSPRQLLSNKHHETFDAVEIISLVKAFRTLGLTVTKSGSTAEGANSYESGITPTNLGFFLRWDISVVCSINRTETHRNSNRWSCLFRHYDRIDLIYSMSVIQKNSVRDRKNINPATNHQLRHCQTPPGRLEDFQQRVPRNRAMLSTVTKTINCVHQVTWQRDNHACERKIEGKFYHSDSTGATARQMMNKSVFRGYYYTEGPDQLVRLLVEFVKLSNPKVSRHPCDVIL